MKITHLIYALAAVSFFGCSSPKEEVNPASADNLKVTASAGLLDVKGNNNKSASIPGSASFSGKRIVINMTDGNRNSVLISLDTLKGIVGTYTIDQTHNTTTDTDLSIDQAPYIINITKASTIKITGYDRTNNTITGVYALNCYDFAGKEVIFTGSFNTVEVNLPLAKRFTATVNGSNLVTTSISNRYYNAGTSTPLIIANNSTGNIKITINEALVSGATYDLSNSNSKGTATYYINSDGYTLSVKSGSLKITSYNSITHRLIGTFDFTTSKSTITNGTFNVVLD